MSKPDWKDIPAEFNWLAQDASGLWAVFDKRPVSGRSTWLAYGVKSCYIGVGSENVNWRQSLEQRPQAAPDLESRRLDEQLAQDLGAGLGSRSLTEAEQAADKAAYEAHEKRARLEYFTLEVFRAMGYDAGKAPELVAGEAVRQAEALIAAVDESLGRNKPVEGKV